MLNKQARERVPKSAANPLCGAKTGQNSAAGRLSQIVPKHLK
jgi:hypothetical protein